MDIKAAEEQFSLDLMQSESLRSLLVGIATLVIIIGFGSFVVINYDLFHQHFSNTFYLYAGIILLLFLALRGFALSYAVKIFFKRKKKIPLSLQLMNVFFEVTIPSLIIIFFAYQTNPFNILTAPVAYLYFIMIILTIMEMDMRISSFAGILAGLEFFLISYYFGKQAEVPGDLVFISLPMFYVGKSLIMVVSGLIAGYLAERIKKRAIDFYMQQKEKLKIEQLFGQQLSPEIAHRLIEQPALNKPEKHEACLMFLDVRDFTHLTENMTPEEIILFQNYIFPEMFRIVISHKGIINQVMGDGFMATFGAPVNSENACEDAFDSAKAILARLRESKADKKFPKYRIGIGLHYGPVVTGNIGSDQRMQFSITGQTVIIASRIEQLNKALGTQILFSDDVRLHLADENSQITEAGLHNVKGLSHPIRLFSLAEFSS